MSIPRYPEYKSCGDEKIGEFPSHWVAIRVRHLLGRGNDGLKIGPFGSALTSEMLDVTGRYKVYGQENVISRNFVCGTRRINGAKFDELSMYAVRPGDILITMMGTSGRCDVVPVGAEAGIMDSHLLRIRLRQGGAAASFVRLLIDEAEYVRSQVRLAGKGSIMHGLNSSVVKDLILLLPPEVEQELILAFLDRETAKIDALIAEQERLIRLLEEKEGAFIARVATKGILAGAPMRCSGIDWLGEIPSHVNRRAILTR